MPPPRPHPLARGRAAQRLNALLGRSWERGWTPRPDLTVEAICAAGTRGFAAVDEGGGRSAAEVADFRARLEVLVHSLRDEARLNNLGLTTAYGMLVRTLRQRWALGRLWRRRPELAATPLAPPIVVLGQMRGGTTRVHRLLAADPAHSATRFCDAWNPVPERPDLRPLKGAASLRIARVLNPWIDILHPMTATGVEEELGWLATALGGSAYYTQWHVPAFTQLCEEADPAPLYAELRRILATDAAHHRTAHRPRVLKVPEFCEAVPALLRQFPDARLVVAHRDPADVVDSAASLVAAQMAAQTDAADHDAIRAEWRRKTALREDRVRAALHGIVNRVAEVDFDALNHDWRSAMAHIYRDLGLDFTPATQAAMERMQAKSDGGAHHAHRDQIRGFRRNPAPGCPSTGG